MTAWRFTKIHATAAAIAGLLITIMASAASADPPGRVARISFLTGPVSFRPAALDGWSTATLNYPLTIGDHVWTDSGARIELQLGSTIVRLAPRTEFSLLNLDDRTVQLRVTEGSLSARVRNLGEDETIEVDTPNGAVSLFRPGFYRVDVADSGDISTVTVRHGEAEVSTGGSAFPVRPDQSVTITGLMSPAYDFRAAAGIDGFEDWCLARDRRAENLAAARYVPPTLIGYEDLDDFGAWRVVGEYGPIWVPRVRVGWVPYRFGHWVWIDPWGWTWVDDEPWGFAPFHYGRWVFVSDGWAWVPGTIVARPVYAPALVAFVGGSNWSVSLGFGSTPVAWFPLGPREAFVPAYRVSPVYLQTVNEAHVNVTNVNINVTNITYVNRDVPGAVTAVPRDVFVQARPVAALGVAVPRDSLRSASVVGTAAPVAPQTTSIVGQATVRASAPPPAVASRAVVVKSAPPPTPLPFTSKQAVLAAHPGQPLDQETERTLQVRTAQPAVHPLVRAVAMPRTAAQTWPTAGVVAPASASGTSAVPASRSAPTPARPAQAPSEGSQPSTPRFAPARAASPAPAAAPAPASQPASTTPSPTLPPNRVERRAPEAVPRSAQPAVAQPNATPPDLSRRHAQERAEIEARHAQERSEAQARHQEDERRAADERERERVRQQHQDEMRALEDRQRHEREEAQKRQDKEREGHHRKSQDDKKGS